MAAKVALPVFHAGQVRGYKARGRFNAWRCGRRFGKDITMITIAADRAAKGGAAGLFAPEHKQLTEPYDALEEILASIKSKRGSSRSEGRIKVRGGGVIDFWPLNDNPLAGRGREYDDVLINEAAFTKRPQMLDTWRKAIRPTLLVRRGRGWVFSTPNGDDEDDFFYSACKDRSEKSEFRDFVEFHAPTSANPLIEPAEIEREREINHPLVFKQEWLAEFVDWKGVQFFGLDKWLVGDKPVPYPERCDTVVAVIDTALKDGQEHDATGVLYAAFSQHTGHRVILLDWQKVQIQGAFLEDWLPSVYTRLNELAKLCGARMGPTAPFIEDRGSGTVLLQQARRRGWRATALPEDIVALGKDGRALSISGYHYQGLCKISQYAHDKIETVKGSSRNHLMSEVLSFRLGDPKAHKRADEMLDDYCYLLSLTCGDGRGF